MSCPKCGGTSRRQIAPSFFECTSEVVVGLAQGYLPVPDKCRTRYHEGAGIGVQCRCGTVAIRTCRVCSRPLCGDHSVSYWNIDFDILGPDEDPDTEERWHCQPCVTATEKKLASLLADAATSRRRTYRALPEVPRELLTDWIAGRVPTDRFVDGTTHQAAAWSARDVASVVRDLFGPGYDYVVDGRDGKTRDPKGHFPGATVDRPIGDPRPKAPEERRRERQRQLDLQNDDVVLEAASGRLAKLKTSRVIGDSLSYPNRPFRSTVLEPGQRFNSYIRYPGLNRSDTDLELFAAMRRTYSWNLDRARELRAEARREAEEQDRQRRKDRFQRTVVLVVLAVLAVIVIALAL